jgi:hypothetical protein
MPPGYSNLKVVGNLTNACIKWVLKEMRKWRWQANLLEFAVVESRKVDCSWLGLWDWACLVLQF